MHYYVHLSIQQQRMSDLAERYLQSVEERGERTGRRSVETEVRREEDLVSEKCDSVLVM